MSDYTQRNYTFSVFFTQCELGKCNYVNSFKRWWPSWRSVDRETVARRPHPHPHIISPAGKFVSYNPPTSQLFTYNPLHSRDTEHSKEFQWDKTKDQDVRFWQTLSRTPCKHGKYLTNFTIFDNSDFVTFYWLEWKKHCKALILIIDHKNRWLSSSQRKFFKGDRIHTPKGIQCNVISASISAIMFDLPSSKALIL